MSLGVDLELCSDEAFTERFPLHRACRDGDVAGLLALLQRLSERSDHGHLSTEDSRYGWTPLHWAAHCGQLECVILLVQMGSEVNTGSSRFDQTPTHIAAFGGHSHCVVWLTQAGADVNRQDLTGETPIHKAARTGSLECIQVLLIAGAQPHVRNACGQTAADLAHAKGFHDCFHLISNLLHLHSATVHSQGSRKRVLDGHESSLKKKPKTDEAELQTDVVDMENGNMDSALLQDETAAFVSDAHQNHHLDEHKKLTPTDHQPRKEGPETCGSLHLSGSPDSSGSDRLVHWGVVGVEGAELLYGHYHGLGDTAEELTGYKKTDHTAMTT